MPTETTDPSLQTPDTAEPKSDFVGEVHAAATAPPSLPTLITIAGLPEQPAIVEAAAVALGKFRTGGGVLTQDECDRLQLAAAQISNYAAEMTPEGDPRRV